jgi:hypothetical protein
LFPCEDAFGLAKLKMPDGGLGEKMVEHFRSGDASPVRVDLDRELCFHVCGAKMVADGKATEFHQLGEGLLTVMDPGVGSPMAPPALESKGQL